MDIHRQKAEEIAKQYMRADELLKELGSGIDGFVFPSANATAVKVFRNEDKFQRELAAYTRLHFRKIVDVLGVSIRLVRYHSRLLVIEMTIVEPPFLLDFAQATIDKPFDFTEGAEEEWWERVEANFEDKFEIARDVFHELQRVSGIHYYDLAPRNMNLGDGFKH